jgi:biotin operon repressor
MEIPGGPRNKIIELLNSLNGSYIKQSQIPKATGLSIHTAYKAVKELKKDGKVVVQDMSHKNDRVNGKYVMLRDKATLMPKMSIDCYYRNEQTYFEICVDCLRVRRCERYRRSMPQNEYGIRQFLP